MLHVVNIVSGLLPQTHAYRARAFLYCLCGVDIATHVRINGGVVIQHSNVSIGAGTWVGRRTEFVATRAAAVVIGANCDISQDVLFITGSHEIDGSERRAGPGVSRPISVGDGCWVGARATFLAGSGVGAGCIVAAGSVVRELFPDNVLLAGVPARIVRELELVETTSPADG
ncbi:acyltransferase [Arthrobacter sp. D1-17]